MKILLFLLALAGTVAMADEVAVLDIRNGDEKKLQRVVIEFHEEAAPRTVANFKKLVRSSFYNGTAFHRVFPHTMVQGGDPLSAKKNRNAVGTGGPGYTLPAEINSHKQTAGAVAMARLPDKINPARVSNGSQFYISLVPLPQWDGQYTVFGNVIQGLDVLDAISTKPADSNDNPVDRVVIESARIVPRESAGTVKVKGRSALRYFRFGL
jgi:cyclophilin family peptidyl-prolyl cis-trans isomerase